MVGTALARGFLDKGYDTILASRNEEKRQEISEQFNGMLATDTPDKVALKADLLVLAVKGTAARAALEAMGIDHLEGKTVIDTTNPIAEEAPENGVIRYFTDINRSLMEELQEMAPKVHFVKAFNSVGNQFMVDPEFESKPTMFICGNDEGAKAEVKHILAEFGWEAEDMGGVESARAIEPLAMLWCIPGFLENRWSHAFKLLRK